MSIGIKLTSKFRSYIFFFVFLVGLFILLVDGVLAQGVPSLEFSATSKIVKVGEDFSVDIVVDTAGQAAHGAGVKINFDPEILQVSTIDAGNIFGDYPVVSFDNNEGKIIVSGIASSNRNALVGRGVFATINLKAIKKGGTTLEFVYQPGSTTDSNIAVTTGTGDILGQVNSLLVTVTSGIGGATSVQPSAEVAVEVEETETRVSLFTRLFRFLGLAKEPVVVRTGRPQSQTIEATAPIPSQQPITDTNQNQPETVVAASGTNFSRVILPVIIILIIISAVYLGRKLFRPSTSERIDY